MSSFINRFNNANNDGKLDLSKFGIIVNPQVETVFDLDAGTKTCPNNSVKIGPCGKPRKLVFDIDDLFKSDSDSDSDSDSSSDSGSSSDSDSSSESESESDELYLAKLGFTVNRETVNDVSVDNSMETDDVDSVYAFTGTEYDNDDVESVYAFDAANDTCLIDYGSGTADDGSVDEADEVSSVYAFESTGSDSDMNDKVEHVHPCDKNIVKDADNSINKPDLSKVVNDNDDVESVYAFDALNKTCLNLDTGDNVSFDNTDVSDSAKDTPCDSKTAALKANTDAMAVLCNLRPILDTVQMVGHIATVLCMLGSFALYMTGNVLAIVSWIFMGIFLLGLIYNDFISERLQECEKRLNLAPTKANSQAGKGNNADKHVIG